MGVFHIFKIGNTIGNTNGNKIGNKIGNTNGTKLRKTSDIL